MALFVEANLDLEIDGQPATLTGSGSVLRLTLSTPRTLRALRQVSLPTITTMDGRAPSFKDAPGVLAAQGLTLEVADQKGLLLILGRGAEGKSFNLPGFGKLEHLKLGSKSAALRLMQAI